MREENNNVSKNGMKRVFRKKWFFPALYLTMAALLLTGVLWYQNLESQNPLAGDEPESEKTGDSVTGNGTLGDEPESQPVMEQEEVLKMPIKEESQAQIVTKFYDYDAEAEDQEKALVLYNNKYYQSKGVDIASSDGKAFDVAASLSGTVTEVEQDPLLGNVVKITHENDVTTYYASLENVLVEAGAEVKQGDVIATAGRNLFGQASGVHVHFEVRQGETAVNPEEFFNQPLSKLNVEKEKETSSTSTEEQPKGEEQPDSSQQQEDSKNTDQSGDEKPDDSVGENSESSAATAHT
ncbi:M23 family metallopeptidase [Radiobacillus deserti]|uniref:M23 family metallopeptidase n=1 Tax=Radiobacillus deserti TaxID=2594883 RepID=A0A516KLH2_9BACI|nr:M23 family metallopeptidase [Radiobacillus deserti]QDP42239.1 M23 family metallopeptidase [Radiobacillus deserti]